MSKKNLSIAIFANRHHDVCEFAINKTLKAIDVEEILFFHTQEPKNIEHDSVKFFHIDRIKEFARDFYPVGYNAEEQDVFSDIMIFIMKGLADCVETDHVLIVQPDGFGISKSCWDDRFLEYDYIGAPTHTSFTPCSSMLNLLVAPTGDRALADYVDTGWWVGGGGFSLRSKKLLQALKDPAIHNFVRTVDGGFGLSEDINICLYYKNYLEQRYNIKFAPFELAVKFSSEQLMGYDYCFGFHKIYNAVRFLDNESECIYYLDCYFRDQNRFFFEEIQRVINELLLKQYYRAVEFVRNRAIVNAEEGYIDIRS
jgi:hypothetical protein